MLRLKQLGYSPMSDGKDDTAIDLKQFLPHNNTIFPQKRTIRPDKSRSKADTDNPETRKQNQLELHRINSENVYGNLTSENLQ